MRKVTFYIDDLLFCKEFYNLTDKQMSEMFGDSERFKATLELYGDNKYPNQYKLTDYTGGKININNLNGYQKGILIGDCYAYYEKRKYSNNMSKPFGVIKIIEEEVNERTF